MLAYLIIIIIVIIEVIIVSYISYKNINSWYFTDLVIRPKQAPPPIIFGIVWFILYTIYAYAWCSSYYRAKHRTLINIIFFISLFLNFLWVLSFFGLHLIGYSKIIIVMLLLLVLYQACIMWKLEDGLSTFLMLIYAGWLIVATGLNFNTFLKVV